MKSLCAYTKASTLLILSFAPVLLLPTYSSPIPQKSNVNNSVSAIFVFGDSTVDPGNNNYIDTLFKSNFPPYGRHFPGHAATGRFTNGKLVTDFAASYVGIKEYIPAYLDPSLTIEDLMTGVSFASATSGFDPITAQLTGVISIEEQLDYFREYKIRLEKAIGKRKTTSLISKAAFLVSSGTNDYVITYLGSPFRRQEHSTFSSYQQFLFQLIDHFTKKGLVEEGARVIGIVGLPPMGCVPAVITLSGDVFDHRRCSEDLNIAARDYNQKLQEKLNATRKYDNYKILYVDIYNSLDDMIHNPSKFGFENVNVGCCGTGVLEASYLCNPKSYVCSDPSKYVFWDAIHPTEAAYYNLFGAVLSSIDEVISNNFNIII